MFMNSIKDQTIEGLDEWLKNNKPTIIPRGASTATGYTPPAPSERTKAESTKHRNDVNRLVREQKKAEELAKKRAEAQKIRDENKRKAAEIHEQVLELITDFKSKAGYGDLGRLAKAMGVCAETISHWTARRAKANEASLNKLREVIAGFQFNCKQTNAVKNEKRRLREQKKRESNPEVIRKRDLAQRKKEAKALGLKIFKGPCATHGMTDYKLLSKEVRCLECEKLKQHKKYEEMPENLKKMKYCLKYGKKSFTGNCEKHGETKFYVNKSGRTHVYRCDMCRKEAYAKQDNKKVLTDAQRYRKLNREMALTMHAADPTNRTFKGMCVKHGETDFYIKLEKRLPSGIAYACKACKNNVRMLT